MLASTPLSLIQLVFFIHSFFLLRMTNTNLHLEQQENRIAENKTNKTKAEEINNQTYCAAKLLFI